MTDLQVFKNSEFGEVRVVEEDGEIFFLGKEISKILGYKDINKAVKMHVDKEDLKVLKYKAYDKTELADLWEGNDFSNKTLINESGLYSLILSSKLPSAKRFKHWVTSEVLPRIRKTGGYVPIEEGMSDSEIMARALLVAEKTLALKDELLKEKEKQIEEQAPKVEFHDSLESTEDCIDIGSFANVLRDEKVFRGGRNKLFEVLRNNGYLKDNNEPYRKFIEMGILKEIEYSYYKGLDSRIGFKTLVTGKGQIYFAKKLRNGELSI